MVQFSGVKHADGPLHGSKPTIGVEKLARVLRNFTTRFLRETPQIDPENAFRKIAPSLSAKVVPPAPI
jgi:hypothetical protein